ncbi:MAG: hypothetical protein ACHQ53_12900 [Polyangiales bacterium]
MAETPRSEGEASVENARCAVHADAAAVAVCARCGDYHCAACHKRVGGRALCATCRRLPGVDYIDETRARYWGKRDGFVWYFGAFGVIAQLLALVTQRSAFDRVTLVNQFLSLFVAIAYFLLYRSARVGLLVVTVFAVLISSTKLALGMGVVKPQQAALFGGPVGVAIMTIGGGLLGLLLVLAANSSPRNKLAFKIPIDDRELQRVYDTYVSNPLALRAAWYAALAVLVPFASAITLGVGIRALLRADPGAWPPRGGRRAATIGIVISGLGLLAWTSLVAITVAKRM